jgi:hypothetical protein
MGQELHQASRLGAKDNTASKSSQVTYTSITSKKSTTGLRPPQRESISISAAGLESAISAASR